MLPARLWRNQQGSVVPLLGIALIPLMAAVGAAVDYSQANAARATLQNAIDSTALMLSKNAALQTNGALQTEATSTVGGGPFYSPPMDPNYKYTQVIILLTDCLNTQDRWYTSQNSIDTRQQKTCDNINAAGITLYTIQVNTDGEATSTLLQKCAGSPNNYPDSSKFFLLTSSSQILNVFTQIGTELSQLRIAQ